MKIVPINIEAGISGFESPAAEYKELGLSLEELLIKHPNATFFGIANGRSMEGKGIYSGDVLVVDRAEYVSSGAIIVANYNGCFVCKVFDKERGVLSSAAPGYAPVFINPEDDFQVEGVVNISFRVHGKLHGLLKCML